MKWHEHRLPNWLADQCEPGTRIYDCKVDDGFLRVMIAPPSKFNGWHLSISHNSLIAGPHGECVPGRYPTWGEIVEARYEFVPDEVYMAMVLPPREEYINVHDACFHLHEIDYDKRVLEMKRGE